MSERDGPGCFTIVGWLVSLWWMAWVTSCILRIAESANVVLPSFLPWGQR